MGCEGSTVPSSATTETSGAGEIASIAMELGAVISDVGGEMVIKMPAMAQDK
jgi:hypothetical protein